MRSTRPASGDPSPCHAPRESHGGSDENETRKRRAGGPQNCGRQDAQNLHLPTNFSYERHRVTEEHAKRTHVHDSGSSSSTSVPAPRGELSRKSVLYLTQVILVASRGWGIIIFATETPGFGSSWKPPGVISCEIEIGGDHFWSESEHCRSESEQLPKASTSLSSINGDTRIKSVMGRNGRIASH